MNPAPYWLVTIETVATGKCQSRRLQAETPSQAGEMACLLVGGPAADRYRVVRCVPG